MSRPIYPPRRFVTIPVFAAGFGGLGTATIAGSFKFVTDCILHTANLQVQISIPPAAGVVEASIAVGFGGPYLGTDINSGIKDFILYAKASNGGLTGPPVTNQLIPFAQRTDLGDSLIRANAEVEVAVQFNVVAPVQIDGGVSLAFTPLSEWVNFREPGIAVRL